MNAQELWKKAYRNFKRDKTIRTCEFMLNTRREAALERKLAAQQREIEALRERVEELEKWLDDDSQEKARLRIIIHNAGIKD